MRLFASCLRSPSSYTLRSVFCEFFVEIVVSARIFRGVLDRTDANPPPSSIKQSRPYFRSPVQNIRSSSPPVMTSRRLKVKESFERVAVYITIGRKRGSREKLQVAEVANGEATPPVPRVSVLFLVLSPLFTRTNCLLPAT